MRYFPQQVTQRTLQCTAYTTVHSVHYSEQRQRTLQCTVFNKDSYQEYWYLQDCLSKFLKPGFKSRARNLRQSIVMKPSFGNPVSWMGSRSFRNINVFLKKYCFMWFLYNLILFSDFLNQNLRKCKDQLGSLVQRYSCSRFHMTILKLLSPGSGLCIV